MKLSKISGIALYSNRLFCWACKVFGIIHFAKKLYAFVSFKYLCGLAGRIMCSSELQQECVCVRARVRVFVLPQNCKHIRLGPLAAVLWHKIVARLDFIIKQ